MKKLILVITIIFVASAVMPVMAQSTKKESEKDLNKKSMKIARKDAKKIIKKGYFVTPGMLPIEKQLEKTYIKRNIEDDNGYPKYILASGSSVAGTQTAAQMQAISAAKQTLAGLISTNVAQLIENSSATQQLTLEETTTITKSISSSKNIIAEKLGRLIPLSEMYKKIGSDNIQCDVVMAYDSKTAMHMAKQIIRKDLEGDVEEVGKKLDKMMNF